MRFIRKQHVITTICNEDVTDDEVVASVLNNLKANRIEFSLTIKKYFSSISDFKDMQYNKVRIKEVRENSADFTIFDKSSTTHLKDVSFDDIVKINAITTVDKILATKPDVTRWDFLDIEEQAQ